MLRLILVPRHRERFEEVAILVEKNFQLPLLRRSRLQGEVHPADRAGRLILLLDTLGELSACWGLADVAFVGGSLTSRGGQNMIEPAGYGAAVLFGPNTQNFKDVVELLLSNDAARVIKNAAELTQTVDFFISNPQERTALGRRAQQLVLAQRGATQRTTELISRVISADETREHATRVA